MEFDLAQKRSEAQNLKNRIIELEQQLADAQQTIHTLRAGGLWKSTQAGTEIPFASEEGYRQALLGAPYPLMIWREDGRILMVNTAFTEISGYTLDDIPTFEEWSHRALGEQVLQQPSLLFYEEFADQDVKKTSEFEVTTRDGRKRIWDFSGVVLGTDQDERWLMITMAVDITERKQIENQLEENELKFSIIFDKAPYAAALSKLPEGVITHINEEFEREFGYTRQEVLGRTSLETGINPDPEARASILEQIQVRGSARNVEAQLHTKSGDVRTCLLNLDQVNIGGQKYILQTAQDITDRKQGEKALRDSEERFSKAFHKSPFGMNITRWRDGSILDANDAWLNLLGWTREEILGKTTADFPFYARPEDRLWVRERITKDEVPGDMELQVVHKDGSELVVDVATTIIEIQGEQCILGVLNDITERKLAEVALQESEQRYHGLFERMQEGLVAGEVITDGHGKPINYRYIDVNPATERQYGIPRGRFIGQTYTELLPDGDPEWISILGKVALSGEPANLEKYSQVSGKWFEAHAYSPRPGQFVNILTDITERKKAENALRQSEERFAKAFHSSPDAIIISRLSDGLILEVNQGWHELSGYKPEEVFGRTTIELGIWENIADRSEIVHRLKRDESVRDYELLVRIQSGEVRQVNLSAEKLEINGELCILAILRDITDRKKAEEYIAYQASLLANVNDAIVGADAQYRLTAWNATAESIYGWKAEEVLGRNGMEILQTQWPHETADVMRRRIAETGSWRGEATQLRRDGTRIPVEVSSMVLRNEKGEISGYVTVNRDITERKKVDQVLRESEQRFRSLANSMPQLVWTALPDGRVDYYNDRHQEYQHITRMEGEDWDWAPVLHPEDAQATVDAWLHSVETGEIYQIEHRVRMMDGSYRWHLSRGVPILNEKGLIIRWFGTATDIHDLKLAEEQLKIYANRLEQSNRELEQFAFMASHDLQEPLRKIEMFGDLLLERAANLQANERDYLDRMRNAAGRMRDMIEGLLQISRVATQGKAFIRVELSRVMKEVISDFEYQIANSDGKVEVGRLPVVTGDPLQLRQLMQNLIGNALKYRSPGKSPEVRIYANSLPDKVQIFVEDKGIGFDPVDADRIFEPFQRLVGRNEYEGSGIGLAICRRIVERHGGEIAAVSEPGQGTTFIVTLPNEPAKKSKRES